MPDPTRDTPAPPTQEPSPAPVHVPETATVLVRMSPEVVRQLETVGWSFGEPDADGFYAPMVTITRVTHDATDDEHWHYGPSELCPICRVTSSAPQAPHLHPNYDCGGKGHGPDVSEVQWCHDCTPPEGATPRAEGLQLGVAAVFQDHRQQGANACYCGWRPNIGEPSWEYHQHLMLKVLEVLGVRDE